MTGKWLAHRQIPSFCSILPGWWRQQVVTTGRPVVPVISTIPLRSYYSVLGTYLPIPSLVTCCLVWAEDCQAARYLGPNCTNRTMAGCRAIPKALVTLQMAPCIFQMMADAAVCRFKGKWIWHFPVVWFVRSFCSLTDEMPQAQRIKVQLEMVSCTEYTVLGIGYQIPNLHYVSTLCFLS